VSGPVVSRSPRIVYRVEFRQSFPAQTLSYNLPLHEFLGLKWSSFFAIVPTRLYTVLSLDEAFQRKRSRTSGPSYPRMVTFQKAAKKFKMFKCESISPKNFQSDFCTNIFLQSFYLITVWLFNFWCNKIGAKAAHKILVKSTADQFYTETKELLEDLF